MCALLFRPNEKVVFIGDSITDCGRRAEPHAPYGAGYMAMTAVTAVPGGVVDAFDRPGPAGVAGRGQAFRWGGRTGCIITGSRSFGRGPR